MKESVKIMSVTLIHIAASISLYIVFGEIVGFIYAILLILIYDLIMMQHNKKEKK